MPQGFVHPVKGSVRVVQIRPGVPSPVEDNSSVTPGTYGDSTNVGSFTVDSNGRVTDAADVPIAFPTPLAVTFGTGAPATPGVTDGDLYFDDTLPVYAGYVWRDPAWNQF